MYNISQVQVLLLALRTFYVVYHLHFSLVYINFVNLCILKYWFKWIDGGKTLKIGHEPKSCTWDCKVNLTLDGTFFS